jgi:hypothetical protein
MNPDERGISRSAVGGNQSSIQRRLLATWRKCYCRQVMKSRSENRVMIRLELYLVLVATILVVGLAVSGWMAVLFSVM